MPLQILVADDNANIRNLIRDCLEIENYLVLMADNGIEALNLAKQYHPHLLISDIKMPSKNGYELVKELREIPQFRLLPVIFLTNQNSSQSRISGYEAGCDVYLAKPFHPNELITIVRHLLDRSQIVQSEILFSENHHGEKQSSQSVESNQFLSKDKLTTVKLTQREKQVLELISQGLSNIQIAKKLYLSPKTIEKYVSKLLSKTQSRNRTELVSFAFKHQLV